MRAWGFDCRLKKVAGLNLRFNPYFVAVQSLTLTVKTLIHASLEATLCPQIVQVRLVFAPLIQTAKKHVCTG